MSTHENHAAIGREPGKVDTNGDGLAIYSLRLTAPPGIRSGTEPDLTLEYLQGAPNGSLGVGWALGGLSTIRRAPVNRPWDQFNTVPSDYQFSKSRLALNGAELLSIEGAYDAEDARYTTELEGTRKIVSRIGGTGFLVIDDAGLREEYGTTDDSVVNFSDTSGIREWRLKRSIDYHGNTITYYYLASISPGDTNTCYVSRIQYTSNENTGYEGRRVVDFEYSSRTDTVVQTVQGDKCSWASLLKAVHFSVLNPGQNHVEVVRTYELEYATSPSTGESTLVQVTEIGSSVASRPRLLPSRFMYTTPLLTGNARFEQDQTIYLDNSQQAVALFGMNITGRALTDLAYVQYDSVYDRLNLKSYLAHQDLGGATFNWKQHTSTTAEMQLPSINRKDGFPSILCPDWNNDGRADLIIPFNDQDSLSFSLSKCTGTGFLTVPVKKTNYDWVSKSRFMTVEFTGRGNTEILQIYTERNNKIMFRTFAALGNKDDLALADAVESTTAFDDEGTIDWCMVSNTRTGARCLVRIWGEDLGRGLSQLKYTTFGSKDTTQPGTEIIELNTADLGAATPKGSSKLSVLPCDINADGAQDIVLARADYQGSMMILTCTTYLDNGAGGFEIHGEQFQRDIQAPEPNKAVDPGEFFVTNLSGANYPTLSYVYQARMSNDVVCLSVDGRSDGSVGDVDLCTLAQGLGVSNVQVMSVDIDGNGIGDWLLYDLAGNDPFVIPVYNRYRSSGLLSQTVSPMGLRTSISYGHLSDPAVYTPSVDWTSYTNANMDSYPLIGSPGSVVKTLDHSNEASINSLEYHVQVKKKYANARVSSVGRGWQGFERIESHIESHNVSEGILTTERYHQEWPMSGSKYQVDTRTLNGEILQSQYTLKDFSTSQLGSWKIYRINKKQEKIDVMESGQVVRSNGTDYAYDEFGNMILRSPWEIQRTKELSRMFERSAYTTADNLTGVMTAFKVSANVNNTDMTKFEPGDCTMTLYKNELQSFENPAPGVRTIKNVVTEVSEWSSDVADFVRSKLKFNQYGKLVETINAAGLTETTIYDDIFHTFAVKTTSEGTGLKLLELAAFDIATGMEVARKSRDGRLLCHQLDAFGRICDTRVAAPASTGSDAILGSDFMVAGSFVGDTALVQSFDKIQLYPHQRLAFEREKSAGGSAYILTRLIVLADRDSSGQYEQCEYLDCTGRTRKRSTRDGDESHKTWQVFDFNTLGSRTFESFPSSGVGIDLDWHPDRSFGTSLGFDTLGRPIKTARPAHAGNEGFLIDIITYTDGGATVEEKKYVSATTDEAGGSLLLVTKRCFVRPDGRGELLVRSTQDGRTKEFEYDGLGQLVLCRDADQFEEQYKRNTHGQTVELKTRQQTSQCFYDNKLQLIRSEVVGTSRSTTYHRDCLGRLLEQVAADGRTVQYTYDKGGVQNVASITVHPRGLDQAYESRLEFDYDERGRTSVRKLTLADGHSYTEQFRYDWQDRLVEKVQPDGVVVRYKFSGTRASGSSLSGGTASTWNFKSETLSFDSFGRPTQTIVQGTGSKDIFHFNYEYDSQGFPLQHRLSYGSTILTQEHYMYNGLDQIIRKHEIITGSTTDYKYAGLRLSTFQPANGPVKSYSYDSTGNLTHKAGTDISYEATGKNVSGTEHGRFSFEMSYDASGHLARRQTKTGDFSFEYDSFGSLQSVHEAEQKASIKFWSDHSGAMYRRQDARGTIDLFVSSDFSIHVRADGSRVSIHKLLDTANPKTGQVKHLGTMLLEYDSAISARPLSGGRSMQLHDADTKGSITRTFRGEDGSQLECLEYDPFGQLSDSSAATTEAYSTYEGNFFDRAIGLLNFNSRFYDPLAGRFTSPDDITELEYLAKNDGLNRYAFENNDPINHVDPTGHWSWSSILGVVIGVVLVVAAIVVTVATLGTASPLIAAAVVGALAAAGVAGIQYSVKHQDETDDKKFWYVSIHVSLFTTHRQCADVGACNRGGFATTVAINAAVGAIAGAATAGVGATFAGAAGRAVFGRVLSNALIGGTTSVLTKMGDKGVENVFYGQHNDLFDGIAADFFTGAATGALASLGADKASKYGPGALRKIRSYTPWKGLPGPATSSFKLVANATNRIEPSSLGVAVATEAAFAASKPSVTLGFWQLNDQVFKPHVMPLLTR